MASLRQKFKEMTPPDLNTLISKMLDIIKTAAPFPEVINLANNISDLIKPLPRDHLNVVFTNMLDLMLYYDAHKNDKGFFPPVHKQIIIDKLNDMTPSLIARPTPT